MTHVLNNMCHYKRLKRLKRFLIFTVLRFRSGDTLGVSLLWGSLCYRVKM